MSDFEWFGDNVKHVMILSKYQVADLYFENIGPHVSSLKVGRQKSFPASK